MIASLGLQALAVLIPTHPIAGSSGPRRPARPVPDTGAEAASETMSRSGRRVRASAPTGEGAHVGGIVPGQGGAMKTSRWWAVLVVASLAAAACSRSSNSHAPTASTGPATTAGGVAATATTAANQCNVPLQATDVGVTPTTITIEVMADVGSSLAPGLFQGNIDAINAFANYINAHGGLACRKVAVRTWDSKLDPTESKNGQIDACANALAMVGTNALFNPDVTTLNTCADKNSQPTGLPDIAAVSADVNEQCAATTFNIQGVPQNCPVQPGVKAYTEPVGYMKWQLQQDPGLHGLWLVAGDLPSTVQVEMPQVSGFQQAGVVWDATPKVSGADTQTAYTPRVQLAREKNSDFVYDGSNDVAMVRMRKEANAQGLTTVKVWGCSIACYTKAFLAQGGSDVEGTYIAMPFLPFEEASYNAEDQNYVNAVTYAKADSFGAAGWQAAVAFEDAVNAVVKQDGPNGLTRANLLGALKGLGNFDAGGWLGRKTLQGTGSISPCFMVLQVQNGKFVRVYPAKLGTMDCNPANLVQVSIDPVAAAAALKS
jgi:hypothetical protein